MDIEVAIIGGGPAAVILAIQLRRFGIDCALIASDVKNSWAESISPEIHPLLRRIDCESLLDTLPTRQLQRAIIDWDGHKVREFSSGGQPLIVERRLLHQCFMEEARRREIPCIRALVRRDPRYQEGVWYLNWEGGGCRAKLVVDAAGRSNWSSQLEPVGPRQLALIGRWRGLALEESESYIESQENLWAWGATLPDASQTVALFLNQEPLRQRGMGLEEYYRECLDRLSGPLRSLGGEREGLVLGADVTCSVAREPVGAYRINIGDAAFSPEPLSSQGVVSAIHSALEASGVVYSWLRSPSDLEPAIEAYKFQWSRRVRRHRELTGAFYAAAAKRVAHVV